MAENKWVCLGTHISTYKGPIAPLIIGSGPPCTILIGKPDRLPVPIIAFRGDGAMKLQGVLFDFIQQKGNIDLEVKKSLEKWIQKW